MRETFKDWAQWVIRNTSNVPGRRSYPVIGYLDRELAAPDPKAKAFVQKIIDLNEEAVRVKEELAAYLKSRSEG